jgi:hypothetical protein
MKMRNAQTLFQVPSHCCRLESNTRGLSPKSSFTLPLGYSVHHTWHVRKILGIYITSGFAAGGLPCHSSTATAAAVVGSCNCNCSGSSFWADLSLLGSCHEIYEACSPVWGIEVGSASGRLARPESGGPLWHSRGLGVQQPSVITGCRVHNTGRRIASDCSSRISGH